MSSEPTSIQTARLKNCEQRVASLESQLNRLLSHQKVLQKNYEALEYLATQTLLIKGLNDYLISLDDFFRQRGCNAWRVHLPWTHVSIQNEPLIHSLSSQHIKRFFHETRSDHKKIYEQPSKTLLDWLFHGALSPSCVQLIPFEPMLERGFLALGYAVENKPPVSNHLAQTLSQLLPLELEQRRGQHE